MKYSLLLLFFFVNIYCLSLNNINDNYIIAVYKISESRRIQIINSYEEFYFQAQKIDDKNLDPFNDSYKNAKQIEDCQMYVDGTKTDFSYVYTFPSEGLHTIKFEFNQIFESTFYMFKGIGLNKIYLSHFNMKNVIYMNYMFDYSTSLESINLNNLNTENVVEMQGMFRFCKKLKSIDLGSFNTPKLKNVSSLFVYSYNLEEIKNINLNTTNVEDF